MEQICVALKPMVKTRKSSVAFEPIENKRKTQVLRWNRWITQGKLKCWNGTNRKHKENTGVAWGPIENARGTNVLR